MQPMPGYVAPVSLLQYIRLMNQAPIKFALQVLYIIFSWLEVHRAHSRSS